MLSFRKKMLIQHKNFSLFTISAIRSSVQSILLFTSHVLVKWEARFSHSFEVYILSIPIIWSGATKLGNKAGRRTEYSRTNGRNREKLRPGFSCGKNRALPQPCKQWRPQCGCRSGGIFIRESKEQDLARHLFTDEWIWQEFRETLRPHGNDVCVCHPLHQQEATFFCS